MIDTNSIQSSLRSSIAGTAERVGPFLVTIDKDATGPFRNFAIPGDGASPTTADLEALLGFFRAHDRHPRWEYLRPAPAVDEALTAAGATVTATLPVLALYKPEAFRPAATPNGIRIDRPGTDEHLRAVAAMQNAAYGEPGVSDADVSRLRRTLSSGGVLVAAWDGDAVVGAGQLGIPRDGLAEVYAVATAETHRRRGIASAVAAELSRTVGVTPYLQAEGEAEQRLYERLGYEVVGELVDARGPVVADTRTPQITGDEGDTLLAFLEYVRGALARKLIGLGEDDARRAVVPSGTSLLWLAKHVAGVEAFWLHHVWAGDPPEVIPDDEDLTGDTVGSILTLLRTVGARTAQIVAAHPDLGELGHTSEFVPKPTSLRWTLAHLVEEAGRHAGHADILRELIDGATGR